MHSEPGPFWDGKTLIYPQQFSSAGNKFHPSPKGTPIAPHQPAQAPTQDQLNPDGRPRRCLPHPLSTPTRQARPPLASHQHPSPAPHDRAMDPPLRPKGILKPEKKGVNFTDSTIERYEKQKGHGVGAILRRKVPTATTTPTPHRIPTAPTARRAPLPTTSGRTVPAPTSRRGPAPTSSGSSHPHRRPPSPSSSMHVETGRDRNRTPILRHSSRDNRTSVRK